MIHNIEKTAKAAEDERCYSLYLNASEYSMVMEKRYKAAQGAIGATGPTENYRYDKGANGPTGPTEDGCACTISTNASYSPRPMTLAEMQDKERGEPMSGSELLDAETNAMMRVRNAIEEFLAFPIGTNSMVLSTAINAYPDHWARGRKRVL